MLARPLIGDDLICLLWTPRFSLSALYWGRESCSSGSRQRQRGEMFDANVLLSLQRGSVNHLSLTASSGSGSFLATGLHLCKSQRKTEGPKRKDGIRKVTSSFWKCVCSALWMVELWKIHFVACQCWQKLKRIVEHEHNLVTGEQMLWKFF